ncbi:MAG: hypothetical protein ACREL7_19615 [Longimicrobiales bacterium]
MNVLLAVWFLQAQAVVLENDYVRVARDTAPCASASTPGCAHRVVVALGDLELRSANMRRTLARGDIAVFAPGEAYALLSGGAFFEVTIKPDHPRGQSAGEFIAPEKNALLHDGQRFFVFEERLAVSDTRARHSHGPRVVIQLNPTRLQQWPDGQQEIVRDIVPDRVGFNEPVIHIVKNVGTMPLHGIVIEFKPGRARGAQRAHLPCNSGLAFSPSCLTSSSSTRTVPIALNGSWHCFGSRRTYLSITVKPDG